MWLRYKVAHLFRHLLFETLCSALRLQNIRQKLCTRTLHAPWSMTQAFLLVEPKIMIRTNTPSRILCYCIINVKSTLIVSFPFCYVLLTLRNFRFCHVFMLNYCSDFENEVWRTRCWSLSSAEILKAGLWSNSLMLIFGRCLVEILKLKFDYDLCKILNLNIGQDF